MGGGALEQLAAGHQIHLSYLFVFPLVASLFSTSAFPLLSFLSPPCLPFLFSWDVSDSHWHLWALFNLTELDIFHVERWPVPSLKQHRTECRKLLYSKCSERFSSLTFLPESLVIFNDHI